MSIIVFTEEKRQMLSEHMEKAGLDLLLIIHSENSPNVNIQYLTGYETWGILLVSRSGERILGAYDVNMAKEWGYADEVKTVIDWYRGKDPEIVDDIKRLGGNHPVIGIPENYRVSDYFYLEKLLRENIPNGNISKNPAAVNIMFNQMRSVKNEKELNALKHSVEIADSMQTTIFDFLTSNLDATELDLALAVEQGMRKNGAEALAFETLVANGNRSWQIHTIPGASNAKLHVGEIGLIDYGCKYKGYCSDITIPFGFGSLSPKAKEFRELVEETSRAAIDALKIGTSFSDIADLANKMLREAGYPLPHSLGHGLGLTVHDSPFIRSSEINTNKPSQTIEPGMAFTIEPGIYVDGVGGVRLENDIIVFPDGPVCVSNSKFLEIM